MSTKTGILKHFHLNPGDLVAGTGDREMRSVSATLSDNIHESCHRCELQSLQFMMRGKKCIPRATVRFYLFVPHRKKPQALKQFHFSFPNMCFFVGLTSFPFHANSFQSYLSGRNTRKRDSEGNVAKYLSQNPLMSTPD